MKSIKLQDTINNQIQAELYSAYLYLAMANECQSKNLKGFANWLNVQYQEETMHAMKLLTYMQDRGAKVELQAIQAPPSEFGTPVEIFEQVLKHELHVTELINNLFAVAIEEKDYAAQMFLQWFVNEQVEEEASATEVLEKLKMAEGNNGALFFIDQELAARTYTPPADTQA